MNHGGFNMIAGYQRHPSRPVGTADGRKRDLSGSRGVMDSRGFNKTGNNFHTTKAS